MPISKHILTCWYGLQNRSFVQLKSSTDGGDGNDSKTGLVVIGAVCASRDPDAQPVIDVTTVAESSTPDATSFADCGATDIRQPEVAEMPSESKVSQHHNRSKASPMCQQLSDFT